MAGRGRGRGRGFTFNIEQLGIGRGDLLPPPNQHPPPLFPPLISNPVPLSVGDKQEYLLTVKREIRCMMHHSPFFIKPVSVPKDIERYTDKYQMNNTANESQLHIMDKSRLPKELWLRKRKRPVKKVEKKKDVKRKFAKPSVDVEKTLAELENKETNESEEPENPEEKNKDEDEDEDEDKEPGDDEFYDEEELEEDTDYNLTYFDNGEGYLDDDDDNLDDGPTY